MKEKHSECLFLLVTGLNPNNIQFIIIYDQKNPKTTYRSSKQLIFCQSGNLYLKVWWANISYNIKLIVFKVKLLVEVCHLSRSVKVCRNDTVAHLRLKQPIKTCIMLCSEFSQLHSNTAEKHWKEKWLVSQLLLLLFQTHIKYVKSHAASERCRRTGDLHSMLRLNASCVDTQLLHYVSCVDTL